MDARAVKCSEKRNFLGLEVFVGQGEGDVRRHCLWEGDDVEREVKSQGNDVRGIFRTCFKFALHHM